MGNVHALAHRVTALSMACLSTAGVIMCAISGFSCSYLSIAALPVRNIMTHEGQEFVGIPSMDIGVLCESPFFDEEDNMWNLSQIFFWIALGLGGFTFLMAWALSTCVAPNLCNWRTMSFLAAATAVVEVPIFLIFESEPCNMDISRQTCSLSLGAYSNMASVVLWVVMTLWTQLLDPPNWTREMDAWRTTKSPVREIQIPSSESATDDCSPQQEGESPRDLNGDLFVTSTENDMAVWSMGKKKDGTAENDNTNDNVSEISDISETDIESGPTSQPKPISEILIPTARMKKDEVSAATMEKKEVPAVASRKSRSCENTDDVAIRKGAALVRKSLRSKKSSSKNMSVRKMSPVEERIRTMGKKNRFHEELMQEAEAAETLETTPKKSEDPLAVVHSPSKAGTPSTADTAKLSAREHPLMDEESVTTADLTGCPLPDGTKQAANLAACFLPDDPCGVASGDQDEFTLNKVSRNYKVSKPLPKLGKTGP
jgi:hypothetical protein